MIGAKVIFENNIYEVYATSNSGTFFRMLKCNKEGSMLSFDNVDNHKDMSESFLDYHIASGSAQLKTLRGFRIIKEEKVERSHARCIISGVKVDTTNYDILGEYYIMVKPDNGGSVVSALGESRADALNKIIAKIKAA